MAHLSNHQYIPQSSLLLFLLYYSIFFLILCPTPTYSILESEALLLFKKSLQNTNALDDWIPNSNPCLGKSVHWTGTICYEGIVTGLRLESMSLSGNIDVDALSKLPGLRTLSIANNNFSGPIPPFNQLGALKALYISGNQFSGEIPHDYFSKMGSLKKVWLSNNKFTGPLPPSLAQLRNLIELYAENNQFSGVLPPLKTPPLVSLNVSNNNLEGDIPDTLASKFDASSFQGNSGLCGHSIGLDCGRPDQQPAQTSLQQPADSSGNDDGNNKSKTGSSNKVVAAVATVTVVALSVLILAVFIVRRKRNDFDALGSGKISDAAPAVEVHVASSLSRKGSSGSGKRSASIRRGLSTRGGGNGSSSPAAAANGIGDLVVVNDSKGVFGLSDLMKAAAEVLGNGGMGSAYKAVMANGVAVAVKRLREMNRLGKDEFDTEMRKLASFRHQNILPPLAYHYRKEEKLVVSEYVPKGSLLYLLHADRGPCHTDLNWPARLKIIRGITRGLGFLHTELASYDLPHGNLKSSNILIASDNEPLIAEYGFSPMVNPNHITHALFAHKCPEITTQTHPVSHKSDVYCLGIVILEILTGKFPSQYLPNNRGGTDIVQWVVSAISEKREADLLDPEIATTDCVNYKEQMVEFLHIGAMCVVADVDQRPSLGDVIQRVEQAAACGRGGGGVNQEARTVKFLPT